jgi:hypothetical protein
MDPVVVYVPRCVFRMDRRFRSTRDNIMVQNHIWIVLVTIRKNASVEDKRLETDICTSTNGVDVIDLHEVLRGCTVM